MSKEKFAIGILVVIIVFVAYLVASLVYQGNFKSTHEVKILELTETEN